MKDIAVPQKIPHVLLTVLTLPLVPKATVHQFLYRLVCVFLEFCRHEILQELPRV